VYKLREVYHLLETILQDDVV